MRKEARNSIVAICTLNANSIDIKEGAVALAIIDRTLCKYILKNKSIYLACLQIFNTW